MGFTLIELLLVIGILGILAVIGLSTFTGAVIKGKDARRKADLSQLAKALEAYNGDFGAFPDDNASGGIVGCVSGTGTTITLCPTVDGKFRTKRNVEEIVYLDKFPTDPDSNKRYFYDVSADNETYSLYTALENLQDKDVKKLGNDPDPAGWGVNCGNPSGSPVCNYKITNSGLLTE